MKEGKGRNATIINFSYLGKVIPIEFTRRKMRHVRLSVLPGGRILLSMSLRGPWAEAEAFVREHWHWVVTHYQRSREEIGLIGTPFLTEEGETFYLGGRYPVTEEIGRRGEVVVEDARIVIRHPEGGSAERVYEKWVKGRAEEIFRRSMERFLPIFTAKGIKEPSLSVKKMRSRWGSCHRGKGVVALSLYLMKTDPACIDYVVLHELTHLIYGGHGRDFKAFLTRYMPDWQERRRALNTLPRK